jgi:hypothetical protein
VVSAANNKVVVTDDSENNEIKIGINEDNLTAVVLKSIMEAKGDLIVATASGTPAKISLPESNPEEYQLIPDTSEESGLKWAKRINNEAVLHYVNQENYTIDMLNDQVIVGVYSTNNMTFTFPNPADYFSVGHPGREFTFKNGDTTGKVLTVKLFGTGIFQNGLNEIKIYNRGTLRMGYVCPNIADGAFLLQELFSSLQARKSIEWSACSFSSATAVPFDITDIKYDENIIEHSNTTNNSRVTFGCKGRVKVSYSCFIDSTGGSTYNVTTYLRKNGTTTIPGSTARTGNYGGEDNSLSIGSMGFDVSVGDYIELIVDQDNLTGYLKEIMIHVEGWF